MTQPTHNELAQAFVTFSQTVINNPYCVHKPTQKQAQFLTDTRKEVLFGGAAGGGKSDAALMAAAQYVEHPDYNVLILRRTYPQLTQAGCLVPRSMEWWHDTAAKYNEQKHTWTFPSGATIAFGSLQHENNKYDYQSGEYSLIIFEELTQFTKSQYLYLRSRLRRNIDVPFPVRIRATSNPGGVGHKWVKNRFFVETAQGRGFIQSLLDDNPYLNADEYRETLQGLTEIEKAQLLYGDWAISPDNATVFNNIELRTITDEEIAGMSWFYNGVDWGFNPDPWCFERMSYDANRKTLYFIDEGYEKMLSNVQTGAMVRAKTRGGDLIVCDSAENKSIMDYRDMGIDARPVKKGAGSVETGVKWLATREKIVIDPARCPNAAREFVEYEHARDRAGEVTNAYVDANNHTIDAGRYGMVPVYMAHDSA